IMSIGVATILLDIVLHFRFGVAAPKNPWNADTLEWATSLPPSAYNFVSLPNIDNRHPLWKDPNLPDSIARGEHALTVIDHGRRETWGSDPLTGKVREVVHLPGNSWLPFIASVFLAVLCLSLLAKSYILAMVATAAALVVLFRWSWENGAHPAAAPDAKTQPGEPPLHSRTCDGPGLWGMGVTLLANGALYLSLLFGWFYLWTVSPQWQVPDNALNGWLMLASTLLLTAGTYGLHRVTRRLRNGSTEALLRNLALLAGLAFVQTALLLWLMLAAGLEPTATAHDAIIFVMLSYSLIHCTLAAILTA